MQRPRWLSAELVVLFVICLAAVLIFPDWPAAHGWIGLLIAPLTSLPVWLDGITFSSSLAGSLRPFSALSIIASSSSNREAGVNRGHVLRRSQMRRHVLLLTTSTFILAYSAMAATAQGPMTPQPDQHHPQQATPGQEGSMMGRGMMERGRMGGMGGRMMGGGMMMGPPIMMRMIFALMDADGDGTISLQEFQLAHERIFKAMDANKDGRLTPEEMQAFMQGASRSAQPQ